MKLNIVRIICIVFIAGAVSLSGCGKKGSAAKAGAEIDKAAEATKDATGKALEKTGESIKKAGEDIRP